MTQDERWLTKYNEVMAFMESNPRNPSRHRIEEHDMLNWLKANRKKMNVGELKEEREKKFKELQKNRVTRIELMLAEQRIASLCFFRGDFDRKFTEERGV